MMSDKLFCPHYRHSSPLDVAGCRKGARGVLSAGFFENHAQVMF